MTEEEFNSRFGKYNGSTDLDYHIYEGKIKQAVKEAIDKVIHEKHLIEEFYLPRNVFVERVKNLFEQIFQNYCLIYHHNSYGIKEYADHWHEELDAYLNNIRDSQISTNNSFKSRKKAITQAFNEKIATDEKKMLNNLYTKLDKEKIDVNDPVIKEAIDTFFSSLDRIADELAKTEGDAYII